MGTSIACFFQKPPDMTIQQIFTALECVLAKHPDLLSVIAEKGHFSEPGGSWDWP